MPEIRILPFTIVLALAVSAWGDSEQPTVTVVREGRSSWSIVCASRKSPPALFAVDELRQYIRQMSGCDLPLAESPGEKPAIVVGLRSDLPADTQSLLPPAASGHDGYAVAMLAGRDDEPDRIIVAGENGPGVVYGAYDLLERFGCRWCYPTQDPRDPEVVPVVKTLSQPDGRWTKASPMRYRICNGSSWFFEMNLDAAGRQLDWAMKNRYNAMGWQTESKHSLVSQYERLKSAGLLDGLSRRGMFLHGPAHSFDHFLMADDYMAEHPEWFGMRDGKRVPQTFLGAQFCWSNLDARRQFTENVVAFVQACPRIHILCIVPFDGGRFCACPECQQQGASNLLMTLMAEVIEAVDRVTPGLLVETVGGYEPMTEPPTKVDVHPRQRVIWAHWGRYYNTGYGDERYDRKDNLEKWRQAAHGGITLCQYYTDNFAEPWIIPPFAISIEGDRRYFIEQNIDAVYMLMWPPDYWWNHSLNGYLAGRCFYDASLDPYQEIHDWALHYFGPQAGPLLGAYYEQWARHVELAYRVKDNARDEDRAMLAEQRRQWIDPAIEATREEPVLAYRVSKVARLHGLAEKLGELHRLRAEMKELLAAGELAAAEAMLVRTGEFTEQTLAHFGELADLDQGLIDRNEVNGFIKMGLNGWLDEQAKALTAAQAATRPATQPR